MNKRIIYKIDDGGVAVIIPTAEGLARAGGDILKIGIKDVPAGKKFAVIDVSELPANREERNAWVVDESILTDGIGGESNEF